MVGSVEGESLIAYFADMLKENVMELGTSCFVLSLFSNERLS